MIVTITGNFWRWFHTLTVSGVLLWFCISPFPILYHFLLAFFFFFLSARKRSRTSWLRLFPKTWLRGIIHSPSQLTRQFSDSSSFEKSMSIISTTIWLITTFVCSPCCKWFILTNLSRSTRRPTIEWYKKKNHPCGIPYWIQNTLCEMNVQIITKINNRTSSVTHHFSALFGKILKFTLSFISGQLLNTPFSLKANIVPFPLACVQYERLISSS